MRIGVTVALLALAASSAAAADRPSEDGPLLILPIDGPESAARAFEGELARSLRSRLGQAAITTMAEVDVALSAERTRDVLGCTDVSCLAEILGALGGQWALGVTLVEGETLSDVVVILRDLHDATRTFRLERRTPSLVSARLRDLAEDVAIGIMASAGWQSSTADAAPAAAGGGTLHINTAPLGARLFLNDDVIGRAPVSLAGLASGSYRLRVADIGYQTFEDTVRIEPGENRTLDLELSLLRDVMVGVAIPFSFRGMSVREAGGAVDGTMITVGAGAWYEREIWGPLQVGGSAGYHWTSFGRNITDSQSETFSSHHGGYAMVHASAGWFLGLHGLAKFAAAGASTGEERASAEEMLAQLEEVNVDWPMFSVRLRAKLAYFSPAFVSGQLGVELGMMGVMHIDIGWAPLLFRPSLPYERDGVFIEGISTHALAVNIVLGASMHYQDPR